MNADDRGPAGEAKPPITPAPGEAPVRRAGFMPATGSVPQRTAFRPVTGTHPTTTQAGAPAAAPHLAGPRPGTYAPPAAQGAPQAAPRAAAPEQSRPAAGTAPGAYSGLGQPAHLGTPPTAPTASSPAAGVQRAGAPTAGGAVAFGATGAATSFAPTTGVTAPGAAGTLAPVTGATDVRPEASSFGMGRLKGVAVEKSKDTKTPVPGAPRKVRVLLSRIDPWSALKIGFLVAIAFGIMTVVAMHILWMALNQMDTFVTIQEWVSKLFTQDQEVNILQFFAYSKVMSATLLVAVVNVVLISGLSVIAAFIYNMISRVVGGVYMTLTDD